MNSRWLTCVLALFALTVFGSACKGGGGSSIEILTTSPEARQTEVPVETRIGFRMNAPIEESSLTNETFFLTDGQGGVVPSSVFIGDTPDTAELKPEDPLALTTTFTVTLTTGLRSTAGAKLEEDFEWTFTTLDSAWGDDEWLEEIGTGSSSVPEIAVDAQQNAMTVWQYEDTFGTAILAKHYNRIDLWGEPVDIDDGNGSATNPKLAVDDLGNGFAVWERASDAGSTSNIWTNRYDVDDGWGTAELLQNGDVTFARRPSVAADPAGNAIAVWVQSDTTTGDRVTWANRYEPGDGWGAAGPIDDMPTARAANRTAVDMDDDGNGIAVWERPTPRGGVLWANRYTAGSGWGTAELISDPETGARDPRLDVGPGGDAFVVWVQNQDTREDIWGIRFSGSSWESPVRLDSYDEGNKQTPDIAVDGTGIAHVVWSDDIETDDDFENIWATQYTPGSGWSAPGLIEPPNDDPRRDSDAISPRIAVNAVGDAFVVWLQHSESWLSVWSNRLDPGTGWIGAEVIEQLDDAARQPRIAVDDARHAHAVWPHSRGNLGGDWLRTNRFE
jgi:hypothetical protein